MRPTFVPQLGENFEYLTFQRMMRTDNTDASREVSEVGSVS